MSSYSRRWIIQRVTAIFLIPITFWFVYSCVLFSKFNYENFIVFFNSYLNSFLFTIMIILMSIHSKIGIDTIIEDYVSSIKLKRLFLVLINIVIILTILISVVSIILLNIN